MSIFTILESTLVLLSVAPNLQLIPFYSVSLPTSLVQWCLFSQRWMKEGEKLEKLFSHCPLFTAMFLSIRQILSAPPGESQI
jgi:hypothetical protein